MFRKIIIEYIPHKSQRYPTVGDWFIRGSTLFIKVSDEMGFISGLAVAFHEIVEAVLCIITGVSQKEVDDYDMLHSEYDEPGNHKDAPYHKQHMSATIMEKLICKTFRLTWVEHNKNIDKCV